ncbi:MAG: RNase J family beta-CASP ribonuclease, partial [Clostridia bacterium]|nr:RNase J family beta-CASP ribonuclease [Clostridia bacterium]
MKNFKPKSEKNTEPRPLAKRSAKPGDRGMRINKNKTKRNRQAIKRDAANMNKADLFEIEKIAAEIPAPKPAVKKKPEIKREKQQTPVKQQTPAKHQTSVKHHTLPAEKTYEAKTAERRDSRNKRADRLAAKKKRPTGTLKIIPLGGLQEIGKNMTLFEYGEDIVIVDAGLAFPDEDMPGVDLVIPDFSYVVKNAHKIRALLITHGHEDHIGGVPYLLSSVDIPVYGTRLSLGIIEGKLDEMKPPQTPRLYTVEAGDVINLGVFKAEFIHVNHSIADACAISLTTPVGTVFHSGDFKLDVSPIDGNMMDLTRIGEIGREGVKLLLCESTNAERNGYTPSERTVGNSLDRIFMQNTQSRLIIATFSSNVHRVQQIINTSAKYGRKVAVIGRSMVNIIGAAAELGYMELPDDVLIDINNVKRYKPEEITLITTGSQGEPMSALYRIAFSEHDRIKLSSNDVVVLSSSAIPGNEKLVGKIINALVKNGVKVVNDSVEDVHVSGHACSEEIKLLMALLKPEYFMPIHGENRHLYANKQIAEFMGISPSKIFISELGKTLEITAEGAGFGAVVPAGNIL